MWLDSHITPIYKPGRVKTDPAGYRPVGVTNTLCRIFEKRINDVIDHHLEENCLIDDSQHGFRRGRSCETNLLVLMEHHAQRAEDNEDEDNCYFDLRAFFDGIPHQRCLASLHSHGVSKEGKIHKWVTAWLGAGGRSQEDNRIQNKEENKEQDKEPGARSKEKEASQKSGRRRQRVILNGRASEWHDVTASIVQGSTLGPTLAKCFSNSSHEGRNVIESDKSLVSKFAVDEKRCRTVMSQEQGDRMQQDINHMVMWTSRMGVELNQEKVHLLHIGRTNSRRKYTIGEGGPEIVSVEQKRRTWA